jgi:putative NADH-flavin reductase
MRLLVIGASSGIGLETVKLAVQRGHQVRAFARSADQILLDHPALEKTAGDATDAADIAAALHDIDAVIVALGVPKTARAMLRPVTLFSSSTEVLLPAMHRAGVARLLVVTGFGAGDSYAALSSLEKIAFKAVLGRAYQDKDRLEAMVRDSGLDWTLVRPTLLSNGPARPGYKVLSDPATWRNGIISRASVADFLVKTAESGDYLRSGVVVTR